MSSFFPRSCLIKCQNVFLIAPFDHKQGFYGFLALVINRISEYSTLEGTHEDHQVQFLNEWPMHGSNPGSMDQTTLALLAPGSNQLS